MATDADDFGALPDEVIEHIYNFARGDGFTAESFQQLSRNVRRCILGNVVTSASMYGLGYRGNDDRVGRFGGYDKYHGGIWLEWLEHWMAGERLLGKPHPTPLARIQLAPYTFKNLRMICLTCVWDGLELLVTESDVANMPYLEAVYLYSSSGAQVDAFCNARPLRYLTVNGTSNWTPDLQRAQFSGMERLCLTSTPGLDQGVLMGPSLARAFPSLTILHLVSMPHLSDRGTPLSLSVPETVRDLRLGHLGSLVDLEFRNRGMLESLDLSTLCMSARAKQEVRALDMTRLKFLRTSVNMDEVLSPAVTQSMPDLVELHIMGSLPEEDEELVARAVEMHCPSLAELWLIGSMPHVFARYAPGALKRIVLPNTMYHRGDVPGWSSCFSNPIGSAQPQIYTRR
eukprot:jgi/Tetstr1/453993/TSEL_040912.t1